MGILDEAIREHLELKRQHGADDSELKQLEDEAFGPAERPEAGGLPPEPPSEAPTEFMAQPPSVGEGEPAPAGEESSAEQGEAATAEAVREASVRREPSPEIASLQEPPEPEPEAAERAPAEAFAESEMEIQARPEPREEQQPAMEDEALTEPGGPAGPTTEEREAISEEPTQHYDVAGELEKDVEEEDEFFDEQRLSDELDQALEAPEEESAGEHEQDEEEEAEEVEEEDEGDDYDEELPRRSEEDLLDETPDFLEDSDDDQLWFEQKPPKDFDFDD